MQIVEGLTRTAGEVNEKLAARKFAIDFVKSRGIKFMRSPTGIDVCAALVVCGQMRLPLPTNRADASLTLLDWAANKRGL